MRFDTPAPITTVLDIPAGRVSFTATDRADTTVDVQPADPAKNRDVRAAGHTTVGYADGVLRITTPAKSQAFGSPGSLAVTVQLPAGSRIEGKAGAAEFHTAGRLGHVAFDGAYSSIEVGEAASIRLTASAGDVTVGRVTGPAEISVAKGDIRITEAVRGKVVLRTEAGDVSVGAAEGVRASLDAGTSYGRISNGLKNAGGSDAQLDIHATTAYGDISASSH